MTLHCDNCGKELGEYLYGKGGIEERAIITNRNHPISLPDITCNECFYGDLRPSEEETK